MISMMDNLFNDTNIVTLVSRRAAGVWTNLPSLTFALNTESASTDFNPIIWVDFGKRYEMLNHFKINPLNFPKESCLLGIISQYKSGKKIDCKNLITYSKAVTEEGLNIESYLTLSEIEGDDIDYYKEYIERLASIGSEVYMIPYNVSATQLNELDFDLNDIKNILAIIVKDLKPWCLILTFEGQPEAKIFLSKIEEDEILNWCLDIADIILCMVRFDSKVRFDDGIAIPIILSQNLCWRSRIKLLLTRVLSSPKIKNEFIQFMIGYLPYANFIGESVNNGRIPIIDVWCRQQKYHISSHEKNFLTFIENTKKKWIYYLEKKCNNGIR